MLMIPDFTRSGKTSIDLKPRCVDIRPRRKAPSKLFLWTVVLQWSLEGDQVSKVEFPKQLRKFRDEILRSFNADDETLDPLMVKRSPGLELEVALAVSSGSTHLPAVPALPIEPGKPIPMAAAVFKSIALNVTKNVCRVKVTLEVSAPRETAPWFCDLLDSDVTAEFRVTGSMFPLDQDEEDETEAGDDDDQEEEPPGGDGPDPVGELERDAALGATQEERQAPLVEPVEKDERRDLNPPKREVRRRVTNLRAGAQLVTEGSETLPPEPT